MRPNNADPSADPSATAASTVWEPPAFRKLPITAHTRSSGTGPNAADAHLPREPEAPGQPLSKLGFSFEMALPMSSRSEK
jgi:hypothetical protein